MGICLQVGLICARMPRKELKTFVCTPYTLYCSDTYILDIFFFCFRDQSARFGTAIPIKELSMNFHIKESPMNAAIHLRFP